MPKAKRVNSTRRRTTSFRKTSDPIFAAIDNHKKLRRRWLDLEEKLDVPCWPTARLAGTGRGSESAAANRASDAAEGAAWHVAHTNPTTVAGASALLSYIVDEPAVGMFELGETPWHETAFRTVASALKKIAHAR